MMKLYFARQTRAVRIAWLLEELEMPYETEMLKLGGPDIRGDAYRRVHPMGRVPVLEDGDVRIFESGAIVEYLLTRYDPKGMRPAVQSADYPDYLQWLHYSEGMIMPQINILTVETIFLPPERRNEVNVKRATKLLGQSLLPLEARLEGRDFLAGAFSGADIMCGSAVISARRSGIDFDDLPNLRAYAERLSKRPAFQTANTL
jgi:glutathione S-transferase